MGGRVLVAMSGGVDSSAAALLLKKQGYDCTGCTMRLYDNEDAGLSARRTCCSLDDVEDARAAAFRLGIPYHVFNFKDEFRRAVMEKFAASYERGENGYSLKKALDLSKDQSYFLYGMTQDQLAYTLFPLGELRKSEVREIAKTAGLTNAEKPDSQDICFAPDGDYAAAVERISGRGPVPGDFVDAAGEVLGVHRGIVHYTVGQRRGLGISAPERLYVCRISAGDNTVTLGKREDLLRDSVMVEDFHWISGRAPDAPVHCAVKLRSRQAERPAEAVPLGGDTVRVVFDESQAAVAPGQAAVLYDGETVLGGGVILPDGQTDMDGIN